jgi:hypothetical protein
MAAYAVLCVIYTPRSRGTGEVFGLLWQGRWWGFGMLWEEVGMALCIGEGQRFGFVQNGVCIGQAGVCSADI